jgi:hypothetical protein
MASPPSKLKMFRQYGVVDQFFGRFQSQVRIPDVLEAAHPANIYFARSAATPFQANFIVVSLVLPD